MAQPSKQISENIAKPFPKLPRSKLHFHLFFSSSGSFGDLQAAE